MKVLVAGDLFVVNDLLVRALEKQFAGTGLSFEYEYYTDNWPVEPVHENEEVQSGRCRNDSDAQRADHAAGD